MSGLGTAALWSLAQSSVRLACGFLSIKVTAVVLGPAGLALTGQLGNFISLLQGVLGNAIATALVKLGSETGEREPARVAVVAGTALKLVVGVSVAASLLLLAFSHLVAGALFGERRYWPVVVLVALLLPAVLLGQLHNSWFQLHRRFDLMSLTNIVATLLGALVFVAACWAFGLWGGLIGTALAYAISVFVALALQRRDAGPSLLAHWPQAQRAWAGRIGAFYPMLLVHSAALPLALLLVRDTMIGHFGASQAGLWQAAVRLSDMYTMVFLAALSMYSLPTLSAAREAAEFRRVLLRLVAWCFAVGALCAGVLFLLRDVVTAVVFTAEFRPVRDLWPWQLVGDVFMLAGWPMRSALTARQRSWAYMSVEAGIGIGLVGCTWLLLERAGTLAASLSHAIVWAAAFVCLVAVHWRTWRDGRAREA